MIRSRKRATPGLMLRELAQAPCSSSRILFPIVRSMRFASSSALRRGNPERRYGLAPLGLSVLVHLLVLFIIVKLPPRVFEAPPARTPVSTSVDTGGVALVLWLPSRGAPPADGGRGSAARTVSKPVGRARAGNQGRGGMLNREAGPGDGSADGSAAGGSASEGLPPTGGGSVAMAFRAGYADPRLYPPTPLPATGFLGNEFARPHVSILQMCIDSLYVVEQRARNAVDWTRKNKKGGKWGVSPKGIHLGKVTLPPVRFGGSGGQAGASEQRMREYNEIQTSTLPCSELALPPSDPDVGATRSPER